MTTSWDCFDTLVARRRFSPISVFDELAQKHGLPDFTPRRRAAEARAPWTLDSIYDELAKDYRWNREQIEEYKAMEIAAEIDNCCPVMETLRLVKDGDLIVSDMYLPESAVRSILTKCGLEKSVTIHVSTGGKSSGQIWSQLPHIDQHVGDNYHSDVASPQSHGIQALYFTGTQFTPLEQEIGGDLALLMRMVRLGNPYEPGTMLHTMWMEQSQLNIPALVLAALELPAENVAFIMRDCVHLQPIHEALFGTINSSFHCSRIAFAENLPEFQQYVEETAFGKTIVDLQGTGGSILTYWEKVFHCDPDLVYISGTLPKGRLLVHCFHDALEKFNSSPLGSIASFPGRKKCEFDKRVLECQAYARDYAISHIPYFSFSPNVEVLKGLIDQMIVAVTPRANIHISDHSLTID